MCSTVLQGAVQAATVNYDTQCCLFKRVQRGCQAAADLPEGSQDLNLALGSLICL